MTWDSVRLQDVGTWFGGGTPSKSNSAFWTDGEVPWLSPKDMGREVLTSTKDHVTEAAVRGSSTQLVPANSVAVVTRSGILERTIPVAVVPFATTMNQDMKAVVPREGIDPRWIAWGLRAHERELLRVTRKAGTTVASIEMRRFYDFELPVPPLVEQRRIVAILEGHLSRLDAGVRSVRQLQRRVKSMVTSSLARIVDAAAQEAPMTTVGSHAAIVEYGTSAKCHETHGADDVPVLRMGNVKNGEVLWSGLKYLPAAHGDLPRLLLRTGDLLFNRTNSTEHVGKSAVFRGGREASFASYLIRVRFDDAVDPRWANLAINSPQGRAYVASVVSQQVGQANVNGTKLKAFPIPLPSIDRQRELVAGHDRTLSMAARASSAVDAAMERSGALRRSLVTAALSGGLTGTETEPPTLRELMPS